MENYQVKVRIVHSKTDGPSLLIIKMKGDRKVLQGIENFALHYEELKPDLDAVKRLKKFAGITIGKSEEHFMSRREID